MGLQRNPLECDILVWQNVTGHFRRQFGPENELELSKLDSAVLGKLFGDVQAQSFQMYNMVCVTETNMELLHRSHLVISELKEIVPEMFVENIYSWEPRNSQEYTANRVKQVIQMLFAELPAQEKPWSEVWHHGTRIELRVEYKWITVDVHYGDHVRTLCEGYWSDKNLEYAKKEISAAYPEIWSWLKRRIDAEVEEYRNMEKNRKSEP